MAGDLPLEERLVVVDADQPGAAAAAVPTGRVLHEYGDRIRVETPSPDPSGAPAAPPAEVPAELLAQLSETEALGLRALQLRLSDEYASAKAQRPRQGEPWDMDYSCTDEGEAAAPEDAGAPVPPGAPTSAYLEGRVAVGVIMVEGPSADLQFSAAERAKVVAEVQNGLSYLATANPAAGVSFVYDVRVVRVGVPADPADPDLEGRWRNPAMAALGFAADFGGVGAYVRDLRTRVNSRWAYCAFFVKYPVRHFAYASIGGPRVVMHYDNDGWGPDNIDRVFAHETGHVFGCPDEYAGSGCDCGGSWGRFGKPNLNCERCAPGGGIPCLMKGNDFTMCPVTPAHLGWMPSRIVAKHSVKVADVNGASAANGALLIQWPYHGGENQAFRADHLGDGWYRLVALHSTKVLDVEGASTANGARLLQWPWHGGNNQQFRIEGVGDGYARITARHSGRALDVTGSSTANGAQLIQWDYHGGDNQRWLLTSAVPAAHSGQVLDVSGGSTTRGALVVAWPYHGGANQAFRFERLAGGWYRIVAQHSGLVLDVEGSSTANGARLLQWPWHGGPNQQFAVNALGDGNVRITARHSGRALDVAGASQGNGAQILQWDWHGGPNQRWLVPQVVTVAGAPEPPGAEAEAGPVGIPQPRADEETLTGADAAGGRG
ncbi:RICIN domain-containing protein [Geodermatophilus nigrescens]